MEKIIFMASIFIVIMVSGLVMISSKENYASGQECREGFMIIKVCAALMLGLIVLGTLSGCGTSTDGMESSFEELDIDYTTNDNGTYTYNDNIYKYKIEVSGMEGESQVTFIVLTNDTETSFEDVSYSLKKAEMSTGSMPEFVILGWY